MNIDMIRAAAGRLKGHARRTPLLTSPFLDEIAGRQVAAGQRFRQQLEAYWRACEEWADMELEAPEATSQEAFKKGASKRRSQSRSSPKSKRS